MKDEDVANALTRSPSLNQKSPAHRNATALEAIGESRSVAGNALAQGNVAGDRQHVVAVVEQRLVEKGAEGPGYDGQGGTQDKDDQSDDQTVETVET